MSNRSSIDWLELDRLVDGRLDGDAYRELLCQIDADPNGWRQCAMAFLEHQALTKELSAFANDPNSEMLAFMGSIRLEKEAGIPNKESDSLKVCRSEKHSRTPNSKSGSMIGWITMALCIVGGAALGFTLNSNFEDNLSPAVPMTNVTNADPAFASQTSASPNATMQPNQATMASSPSQNRGSSMCGKRRCDSPRYSIRSRAIDDLNTEEFDSRSNCPTQQCVEDYKRNLQPRR